MFFNLGVQGAARNGGGRSHYSIKNLKLDITECDSNAKGNAIT